MWERFPAGGIALMLRWRWLPRESGINQIGSLATLRLIMPAADGAAPIYLSRAAGNPNNSRAAPRPTGQHSERQRYGGIRSRRGMPDSRVL